MLIKLGNLAAATPAGCWDFLGAGPGLTIQDVSRVAPHIAAKFAAHSNRFASRESRG